jgi:hypothetical protein
MPSSKHHPPPHKAAVTRTRDPAHVRAHTHTHTYTHTRARARPRAHPQQVHAGGEVCVAAVRVVPLAQAKPQEAARVQRGLHTLLRLIECVCVCVMCVMRASSSHMTCGMCVACVMSTVHVACHMCDTYSGFTSAGIKRCAPPSPPRTLKRLAASWLRLPGGSTAGRQERSGLVNGAGDSDAGRDRTSSTSSRSLLSCACVRVRVCACVRACACVRVQCRCWVCGCGVERTQSARQTPRAKPTHTKPATNTSARHKQTQRASQPPTSPAPRAARPYGTGACSRPA